MSKKRPAWDLKGRLEDMEAQFALTADRVASLESQNTVLQSDVEKKETVVAQNSQELSEVRAEAEKYRDEARKLGKELDQAKEEAGESEKKYKRQIVSI